MPFRRVLGEGVDTSVHDMAIATRTGLAAHMQTCESNQKRIENEFVSVKNEFVGMRLALAAQDTRFAQFQLEAAKRSNKVMVAAMVAGVSGLLQIVLHFLPTSLHF